MQSETNVESGTQKVEKRDRKYLNPVLGYSVFGGAVAIAIAVALIVLLPLI